MHSIASVSKCLIMIMIFVHPLSIYTEIVGSEILNLILLHGESADPRENHSIGLDSDWTFSLAMAVAPL